MEGIDFRSVEKLHQEKSFQWKGWNLLSFNTILSNSHSHYSSEFKRLSNNDPFFLVTFSHDPFTIIIIIGLIAAEWTKTKNHSKSKKKKKIE